MFSSTRRIAAIPSRVLPSPFAPSTCVRCLHQQRAEPIIPKPTPFVPDVPTFLSLIGRQMHKHTDKFTSWDSLFSLSSSELRELGIEPTRQRRYLLRQREKFKNGIFGPGGDLDVVVDGVAQLRVVEVPAEPSDTTTGRTTANASATLTPGMRKVLVNLAPDAEKYEPKSGNQIKKYAHLKVHRGTSVIGPYVQAIKGTNGSAVLIRATEGMWEDRRGQKVDGGERRRAEVRAKKRSAERRAAGN
jgi:IGR protein motif